MLSCICKDTKRLAIFIDIHTHSAGGDMSLYSYAIGRGAAPPAEGTIFSAGIHPWSAADIDVTRALEYLRTAPLAAIGEIGLDYFSPVDRHKQQQILEAQLEIAESRNLPVVIHCVKAYNDILQMLAKHKLRAVIFHSYIGSPQQTTAIYDAGHYFSFGKRSLESAKTIDSLRTLPHDRIFAETDDSGAAISDIYAALAERLNMSIEELKVQIERNYIRIFE